MTMSLSGESFGPPPQNRPALRRRLAGRPLYEQHKRGVNLISIFLLVYTNQINPLEARRYFEGSALLPKSDITPSEPPNGAHFRNHFKEFVRETSPNSPAAGARYKRRVFGPPRGHLNYPIFTVFNGKEGSPIFSKLGFLPPHAFSCTRGFHPK